MVSNSTSNNMNVKGSRRAYTHRALLALVCLSAALWVGCDGSSVVSRIELNVNVLSSTADGSARALPQSGEMIITPYDVNAKAILDPVTFDLSTGKGSLPDLPLGTWRFKVEGSSPAFSFFGTTGEFEIKDDEARYVQAIVGERNCTGLLPELRAPRGRAFADQASYDLPSGSVGTAIAELPNGMLLISGGGAINDMGQLTAVSNTLSVYDPAYGFVFPTGVTMTSARAYHQATTLDDGRILITGGVGEVSGGVERPTVSAELIELGADGELIVTTSSSLQVNVPRAHHAALKLNDGTVLITGGLNGEGAPLADTTRFFPGDNTFRAQAEMATARAFHAMVPLDRSKELAAVIGGMSATGPSDSVELYSTDNNVNCVRPSADSGCFIGGGNLKRPRWGHVAFKTSVRDNSAIIVGGFSEGTRFQPNAYASEVEAFTLEYNADRTSAQYKVLQVGFLSTLRGYLSGARMINDTILLVGGQDLAGNASPVVTTLQTTLDGDNFSISTSDRCPLSEGRVSPAVIATRDGGAAILGGVRKGAIQLESGRVELFYPPAIATETIFNLD